MAKVRIFRRVGGRIRRFTVDSSKISSKQRGKSTAIRKGLTKRSEVLGQLNTLFKGKKDRLFFTQTSEARARAIKKEGFDVKKIVNRANDEQVPDAVFTKPTAKDINIRGKAQVAARLNKLQKTKTFKHRDAIKNFQMRNPKLADLLNRNAMSDRARSKRFDVLFDRKRKARRKPRGFGSADKKVSRTLDLWKRKNIKDATKIREETTKLLKKEKVGIVKIENDAGSFGRRAETTAVLDPKNLTPLKLSTTDAKRLSKSKEAGKDFKIFGKKFRFDK